VLRHPDLTLKKVLRPWLPSKDRVAVVKVLKNLDVMKALKQKIRKRQRLREKVTKYVEVATIGSSNESFSSTSVTNDLTIWVVLRGSEKAVVVDVEDIGKEIGVSFPGDTNNIFNVLSCPKQASKGSVLTLADEVRGMVGGEGVDFVYWWWGTGGEDVCHQVTIFECEGVRGVGEEDGSVVVGGGKTTLYSLSTRNKFISL